MKVTVRAQDRNGNFFEASGEELTARCFCHELAHLDGHLFVELAEELYTPDELEAMMEDE
jgi:peptide deformylase